MEHPVEMDHGSGLSSGIKITLWLSALLFVVLLVGSIFYFNGYIYPDGHLAGTVTRKNSIGVASWKVS